MPDLMTVQHMADYFTASTKTIWNWANSEGMGFPQPVKIGGRTYWRKADVEEYVQSLSGGLSGGPEAA